MGKALFTNNASGTLASAITTTGATSLVLTAGQGALFPAPTGGDYFYATIVDASNNKEIVKVTANSSDTFTMVRGQDGTTALTFLIASKVELRPTAADFNEKLAAGSNLGDLLSAAAAKLNLGLSDLVITKGSIVIAPNSSGNITSPTSCMGFLLVGESGAVGSGLTTLIFLNAFGAVGVAGLGSRATPGGAGNITSITTNTPTADNLIIISVGAGGGINTGIEYYFIYFPVS